MNLTEGNPEIQATIAGDERTSKILHISAAIGLQAVICWNKLKREVIQ